MLPHSSGCFHLHSNPTHEGVEVWKQVSQLVLGDMALMCQRIGNVSHAAEGGM